MFDFRSLAVFFGAFIASMFLGPIVGTCVGLVGVMASLAAPRVLGIVAKTPYGQYLTFTFFAVLLAMTGSDVIAAILAVSMGLGMGMGMIILNFALFFGIYLGLISYVFPRYILPKL